MSLVSLKLRLCTIPAHGCLCSIQESALFKRAVYLVNLDEASELLLTAKEVWDINSESHKLSSKGPVYSRGWSILLIHF